MMEGERLPDGVVTRLQRQDSSITAAEALRIYQRDQLLWIRLDGEHRDCCEAFDLEALRAQFGAFPEAFAKRWHVENAGSHSADSLTPAAVLGGAPTDAAEPFYCSTILQQQPEALEQFFCHAPFEEPPMLPGALHDDGLWLFIGSNPETKSSNSTSKKRKVAEGSALTGRPEHTDDVVHSGTWHVQLSGSKTWYVRPCAAAEDWDGMPPVLCEGGPGVVRGTKGKKGKGTGLRLRIEVCEGDLLFVNTRQPCP